MKGKMSLVAKETRNHWLLATDPHSPFHQLLKVYM